MAVNFTDRSGKGQVLTNNGAVVSASKSMFGYRSYYFDGASYLSIPDSDDWNFSGNDFTIEMWIYPTALSGYSGLVTKQTNSTGWYFSINSSSQLEFYNFATLGWYSSTEIIPTNEWSHVAAVKSGNAFHLFINGIEVNYAKSDTMGAIPNISAAMEIGSYASSSQYLTGFIDGLRVHKNKALWTENFLPPNAPVEQVEDGTVLLLHCDGTDASTSFPDSGTTAHSVTANGNAQISTTQSKFGGSSAYFDGTGDYLSIPDSDDWNFGSEDFTIEFFANSPWNSNQVLFSQRVDTDNRFYVFYDNGTNALEFAVISSGSNILTHTISSVGTYLQTDTWQHFAIIRNGSGFYWMIDGIVRKTTIGSPTMPDLAAPLIIGQLNSINYYTGYIDEFRISKGIARWTEDFIPPTDSYPIYDIPVTVNNEDVLLIHAETNNDEPIAYETDSYTKLLLHADGDLTDTHAVTPINNPKHVADSPYGDAATGSWEFNGTSQYLTVADSNDFNFGSDDFTLEAFVNFNNVTGTQEVISKYHDSTGSLRDWSWSVNCDASNTFFAYHDGGTVDVAVVTWTPIVDTWYHVAVCRTGPDLKFYIDGVQTGSTYNISTETITDTAQPVSIGARGGPANYFKGNIADARITKGKARYTAEFTPPTAPLSYSDDVYTKLLLHSNGDLVGSHNIIPTGNPIQITDNPYSDPNVGSWDFNGTSQYLEILDNDDFDFGSSDFTIEGWFRRADSDSGVKILLSQRFDASSTSYWQIYFESNQLWVHAVSSSTTVCNYNTTTTISDTIWHHIAIVRNGSSLFIFFDGISQPLVETQAISTMPTSPDNLRIGYGSDTPGRYFYGQIADARITKGKARYTAEFTPPTVPLSYSDDIYTKLLLHCNGDLAGRHDVTWAGNLTHVVDNPYSDLNGGSLEFDGTGDYLTVAASADFNFSGQFTIELQYKTTTISTELQLLNKRGASWDAGDFNIVMGSGTAGKIAFSFNNGTTQKLVDTSDTNDGLWHHLAVTRDASNVIRLFVDGISVANITDSQSFSNNELVEMPPDSGGGSRYIGNIADFRITKDEALYTTNFTPPTNYLSVGANTTLMISGVGDSMGMHKTVAYGDAKQIDGKFNGAWEFDGTGDYLDVIDSPDFDFGSGDFTIDFWMKSEMNSGSGVGAIINNWEYSPSAARSWTLTINLNETPPHTSDKLAFVVSTDGTDDGRVFLQTTSPINDSTYHHIAAVRSGDTLYLFVDGIEEDTNTVSGALFSANKCRLGAISNDTPDLYFNGCLDEVRISKGIARWTSNFTLPTVPYEDTEPAATKLLVSSVGDSMGMHEVVPYGNAKQVIGGKFNGAWEFDGTGDYLELADNSDWDFGSGDFTIEGWFSFTSLVATNQGLVGQHSTATPDSNRWQLTWDSDVINFFAQDPDVRAAYNFSWTPTIDQFYHIAAVRNGANLLIFIGGVSQVLTAGTPIASNAMPAISGSVSLARGRSGAAWASLQGQISDLRITKGKAVYTTNFTPPTAPYEDTEPDITKLLVSGIGDSSNEGHEITYNGNTALSTTGKFEGSFYFDGTGDYLNTPTGSLDWVFGTDDFTIDFWINYSSSASWTSVINYSDGTTARWQIYRDDGNKLNFWYNGSNILASSNLTLTNGQWYHIAIVRSSGHLYMFSNGQNIGDITYATNMIDISGQITIGAVYDGAPYSAYMNGYLDEVRISKGIARWTKDFDPPIRDFGVDKHAITRNGSVKIRNNSETLLGGCIELNGTSDYLSISNPSSLQITGNITLEAWVYLNSLPSSNEMPIISKWAHLQRSYELAIAPTTNRVIMYVSNDGNWNGDSVESTGSLTTDQWYHVAGIYDGSELRVYINGILGGTYAYSQGLFDSSQDFEIGALTDASRYLDGRLAEVRVSNTVKWTGDFTPPTLAYPEVKDSNTKLLLHGEPIRTKDGYTPDTYFKDSSEFNHNVFPNGDVILSPVASKKTVLLLHANGDKTGRHDIATTGTPKQVAASPYADATTGSWEFDGSTDHLTIPNHVDFDVGTGDYTVECWIKTTQTTSGRIWSRSNYPTGDTEWLLSVQAGGKLDFFEYITPDGYTVQYTGSIADNMWHHVAAIRFSGTMYLYIDGISVGTPVTSTISWSNSLNFYVGQDYDGSPTRYNGQIADLRITKAAVYAANFTPPTEPLEELADTVLLIGGTGDASGKEIEFKSAMDLITAGKFSGGFDFDGSNDYIEIADSADLEFGTNPFGVDCWINPNALSGWCDFASKAYHGTSNRGWNLQANGTKLTFAYSNNGTNNYSLAESGASLTTGIMQHVAIMYDGAALHLYLDGVRLATAVYTAGIYDNAIPIMIAASENGGSNFFDGIIDEVRIIKGTAAINDPNDPLYISSGDPADGFTPPIAPYEVTNKSMYFDGTGDYLSIPDNTDWDFGSDNFTIDMWVRLESTGSTYGLVFHGDTGTDYLQLVIWNDNKIYFQVEEGDSKIIDISTGALGWTTNTWYHIAIVRNGNDFDIYRDGVSQGSGSDNSSIPSFDTDLIIGSLNQGSISDYFNGHIDELRISKNIARWVSDFTPPTAPYRDHM